MQIEVSGWENPYMCWRVLRSSKNAPTSQTNGGFVAPQVSQQVPPNDYRLEVWQDLVVTWCHAVNGAAKLKNEETRFKDVQGGRKTDTLILFALSEGRKSWWWWVRNPLSELFGCPPVVESDSQHCMMRYLFSRETMRFFQRVYPPLPLDYVHFSPKNVF